MADFFRQGSLEMQTSIPDAAASALQWGDFIVNRLSALVAVLLWLVIMMDYLRMLPQIWDCLSRWKGNISLEHSISQARTRNVLAMACALPFLLMADRFRMFDPDFWHFIPANLSLAATAGVLMAFLLIRRTLYAFIRRGKMSSEEYSALRHTLFNHFIIMVPLMLLAVGIMTLANVPDSTVRTVLLVMCLILWLGSFLRSGQILASRCTGFSTILYLCALEILPVGIMIFASTR